MSNSKQILIRSLSLLFYLLSTTSAFADGAIRLSDGINVSTNSPMLGDEFRVHFSIRETKNMPVPSVHVQVLMRKARGGPDILVSDFGSISFDAGETIQFDQQYSLVADLGLQPGNYVLAVVYTLPNEIPAVIEEENSTENRVRLDVRRTLLGFEGYIFGRSDSPEFRWIGRTPSGEFGHTWIAEECARLFGAASQTGDWLQLSYLAPAGDNVIDNPCSAGLVGANNVKLNSGVMINPSNPKLGERFEVVFDLRETEIRPVTFSNVRVSIENTDNSATVDLGEIRLDSAIGRRFTAVFDPSVRLEAGTYQAVVRYQLFGGALTNFEVLGEGSNPREFQIQSSISGSEGYVFGRTDSTELRWIGEATSGEFGHIWIDEQCAESLGGISRSGTWGDLATIAPAGDQSVSNPCDTAVDEAREILFVNDGEGYVVSRSDAFEFRWVGRTPDGEFGHTWISSECAMALGGAGVARDWQWLTGVAPAGDQSVSSPCDTISSFLQGGEGYVFGRSDAPELRWIGRSSTGEIGHTRIDERCAEALGGVSARGNWEELKRRAPAGDLSVVSPCR